MEKSEAERSVLQVLDLRDAFAIVDAEASGSNATQLFRFPSRENQSSDALGGPVPTEVPSASDYEFLGEFERAKVVNYDGDTWSDGVSLPT